jgi:two-component system phosphate regulon sensor histidine kinase PhoR
LYDVLNKTSKQEQTIEDINSSLIELHSLLISKKLEINNEIIKSNVIINNINRGIVVIGSDGNILLINNYARELFKANDEHLSKNYIYLFRNIKIQEGIEEALSNKKYISREIKIGAKYYYYNIHDLNYNWGEISTFVLLISEISDTRNTEIMKREFFANASHELKSPLTTIIGYQQMISEGLLVSNEDVLDATTRTLKEARRMNKILTEMLELSKLESRNEVLIEEVNLSSIIKDILESKVEELKKKNIKVIPELFELKVMMNYNHVYQLFNNLIDNAIKYNKDNGTVTITIDFANKTASVIDTGIGIKEEELDRIYERFYRVDKARSKDVGGTGLGLAIVKHVCSLYELKIDTKSSINIGTSITIHFK